VNWYQTNFALARSKYFSVAEIDEMMPWERTIYIALLVNHIKEENRRLEESNRSR
tara:strand:- start:851 stop:1015 length:165 start_codon:yes stop_codon:yes gene_type:complete